MRPSYSLHALMALLCLFHFQAPVASASQPDCIALGFNADKVLCTTCEDVFAGSTTEMAALLEECQACCYVPQEDKYEVIVLEFDKRWIDYHDSIKAMVTEAKKKEKDKDNSSIFQKLKVKTRFGARPTLHMYSQAGDDAPADSISVSSWQLHVLEDYVKSHLKVETAV